MEVGGTIKMRQLDMSVYIKHQQARYSGAKKRKAKSEILNEFCRTTGYQRKHAITVLRHRVVEWKEMPRGRRKTYDPEELGPILKEIWFATNQMCGKPSLKHQFIAINKSISYDGLQIKMSH